MNWAIEEKSYSQRRACGLIGLDRRTYRYASRRSDEVEIRVRLKAVADQRRRFTSPSIAHQTWAEQTTLYTLDEQLLVLARSASCPAEQVFVAGILSRGVPRKLGMANDNLATYKAKRDHFRQTREPSGHLELRMPELIVFAVVWDCLIRGYPRGRAVDPLGKPRVSPRRDLRWDKAIELAEAV